MTKRARFLWKAAVFLCVLTIPVQVLLVAALTSGDLASSREEWAMSLSEAELEAAAAEIQTYPVEIRRTVVKRLSPERRAAVWTSHMQRYLDSNPSLPAPVREAIAQTRDLIGRMHVTRERTPGDLEKLTKLTEGLKRDIGEKSARELLYALGPTDVTGREPLGQRLLGFVRQAMVVQAFGPECQCSSASDWCGEVHNCEPSALNCEYDEWGFCGSGGMYACDGLCDLIEANR